MDEGRKRVIGHMPHADDLFGTPEGSKRTLMAVWTGG